MPKLGGAIMAVVLCAGGSIALAQESSRFSIGGGVAVNNADLEDGDEIEGDGLYGAFQVRFRNDALFQVSLSGTSDESDFLDTASGFILHEEDELFRTAFSMGYLFRGQSVLRPFLHGGLAIVSVTSEIEGFEVVDDSSEVLFAGVGLEAGKGDHHAFYADLSFDFGHEVDLEFGLGEVEFDLTELRLGYMYRF